MRILFDHQIFQNQKFGGISRYFFELWQHFSQMGIRCEFTVRYSDNEYIRHLPDITRLEQFSIPKLSKHKLGKAALKYFNGPLKLQRLAANKEASIEALKHGNFDVFHTTYFDDYFLEHIGDKPFFITVYDLTHQIFPEYFPLNVLDKNFNLLNKASAILAISHSTKRDLIQFFDIPAEKIFVTHLASNLKSTKPNEVFLQKLPEKYVLFVGNRTAYKNFYFFAEVFAKLAKEHPNLHLVCTGSKLNGAEKNFLSNLGIANKVHTHFVDDNTLALLYQNATCFVFPSLYEGFGIPLLEAFENNCPVLASNTSSLPEVGGNGALYFNPKHFKEMFDCLKKVIESQPLRQNLINSGLEQVAKFSWQNTAKETLKIYQQFS